MDNTRLLRKVPTSVLYALHRGIERQFGLSNMVFRYDTDEGCIVCTLGAMGVSDKDAVSECVKYGLFRDGTISYGASNTLVGEIIERLNNSFVGTLEQRREFMLRHIVEELRQRGESVVKTEKKKAVAVPA